MSSIYRTEQNNDVGWRSQASRQPHKLEAVGSNPTPAIKSKDLRFFETVLKDTKLEV